MSHENCVDNRSLLPGAKKILFALISLALLVVPANSHAADLIHEGATAMQGHLTVTDVADMIHAHPTFSEGLMEAAEDIQGLAIHQARKRTPS